VVERLSTNALTAILPPRYFLGSILATLRCPAAATIYDAVGISR